MTFVSRFVVSVLVVAALGCKKHESDSGGSGSGSSDAMPHHMGNCPSTVSHSTTTAAIDGSNVLVTISSDDPEAILAIQKRTDELLEGRKEHHSDVVTAHQQNGEHGGGMGRCPVYIPEGATATSARATNGAVVTIAATDAQSLKTEIDGRIQRAADWMKANIPAGDKGTQGGTGGGKNDEGMNRSGKGDGLGIERRHGGAGSGGSAVAPTP
jgi:hypothetical protein